MPNVSQCSTCNTFVTVADRSSDASICPACQQPLPVEEMSYDLPAPSRSQHKEGAYKILVPLIYIVLFLPIVFMIYYLTVPASEHANQKKEFGTLRITMAVAVKAGREAWVEIDGKRKANWTANKNQVELRLLEGRYTVKVVSVNQGSRRTLYEGEVEVPPNQIKEMRMEPGK